MISLLSTLRSRSSRYGGTALLAAVLAVGSAEGQTAKKPLDHEAYDIWNRIRGEVLSPDGQWLAYELAPGDGDGRFLVRQLAASDELTIERGTAGVFTDDSRFLVLTVEPAEDSVEAAEKARKKDKSVQVPKDRLAMVDLRAWPSAGSDPITYVDRVKSFRVPDEGRALVAWLLEPEDEGEEEAAEDAEEDAAAEDEETEEEVH